LLPRENKRSLRSKVLDDRTGEAYIFVEALEG
jgi:hypothetical protein